jgi:hypothetical protein
VKIAGLSSDLELKAPLLRRKSAISFGFFLRDHPFAFAMWALDEIRQLGHLGSNGTSGPKLVAFSTCNDVAIVQKRALIPLAVTLVDVKILEASSANRAYPLLFSWLKLRSLFSAFHLRSPSPRLRLRLAQVDHPARHLCGWSRIHPHRRRIRQKP